MARIKRGVTAHARHKKFMKMAKGYYNRNRTVFRAAIERVEKGLQYAYRDRRKNKSNFRKLWILRINAEARKHGLTYSQFMGGLKKAQIEIDRKMLAHLAYHNPESFATIANEAKRFIKDNKAS